MSKFEPLFNRTINDSVTVGNSSTEVIPLSPNYMRTYISIRNMSDTDNLSLSVENPAVAGQGIVLKPGEYWILEADNIVYNPINGISDGGDISVATAIGTP